MQKTDSTPGCSCSMVGLTWDSFEFLSKDMLVRYEMGAGVSVWAAYKPEGFSMFGRGIVEDCGQNSPPSGLIQKLETLFKVYVFVFALIMGSSTPHFQLEMKLINELLPAFPVLPPSCSWWHPKAHHFWPGYQFWQGFVPLIWPWFDHCPLSVTDTWVRRAFGSVFCCNVLQCFQKKCDMLQSCFPFFPKCSAVYEGWLSVCLVTKNIDFQPDDRMFFKSCFKISSWCALPYNSEVGVETFDKFSADSLSAFKLILLSHLGIIFSFSNRKDAISKTCNIQYTNSDWMGWSFNVVNVQI